MDLEARVRRREDLHEIGRLRARYCQYLDGDTATGQTWLGQPVSWDWEPARAAADIRTFDRYGSGSTIRPTPHV